VSALWQRLTSELGLVGVQPMWIQSMPRLPRAAPRSARAIVQVFPLYAGADGEAQGGVMVLVKLTVALILGPIVLVVVYGFV
jgi:hypothetical protein